MYRYFICRYVSAPEVLHGPQKPEEGSRSFGAWITRSCQFCIGAENQILVIWKKRQCSWPSIPLSSTSDSSYDTHTHTHVKMGVKILCWSWLLLGLAKYFTLVHLGNIFRDWCRFLALSGILITLYTFKGFYIHFLAWTSYKHYETYVIKVMHPNFHSVERAVWFISKGSEQFYKNSLNKGRAIEIPLDCQSDRISDKTRAEL